MWGMELTIAISVFAIIGAVMTAFYVDSKVSKVILLTGALLSGLSLYSNIKHQDNSHSEINQSK